MGYERKCEKMKFYKGDMAIESDVMSFDIIEDMEVEIGDTFVQWGMTYKITAMSSIHIWVEEVE